MTETDIQLLNDNIDKPVEVETRSGERLIAKVIYVLHAAEYDEHELIYDVLSSNMLDSYKHRQTAGGYVLDLNEIVSSNRTGARS